MIEVHIGSVIVFDYPQGDEHYIEVCGRVIGVRDTVADPIQSKTEFYNRIKRSRHLYTIALEDGKIRTFYAGAAKNGRHATWLERFDMFLRGITFPKFATT